MDSDEERSDDPNEGARSNKKGSMSERRRTQIKWCQEQRNKLQEEFRYLEKSREATDSLLGQLFKESVQLSKFRDNIAKMLPKNACTGPIPEELNKSDLNEPRPEDGFDLSIDEDADVEVDFSKSN